MLPTVPDPSWRPDLARRVSVVLVHGAIVNGIELRLLRWRLECLGYHVRPFYYPSISRGLEENTEALARFVRETTGEALHVVAHSMGGILMRKIFEQSPDPRPGRLVAIGSPFLDCWVGRWVDRFHGRLGRFLPGKTVQDHIRGSRPVSWLGPRDLGILAGTFPLGAGTFLPRFPRPNDGTVLWEETRLVGVQDHITFHLSHFGMLLSRRCFAQIASFLATGRFRHLSAQSLKEASRVADLSKKTLTLSLKPGTLKQDRGHT